MVEITYQMVLSTLQTMGVLVGIYYYLMTVRNQTLLRKSQFLYTLYEKTTDEVWLRRAYTDMLQWNWDDFDDFERKYGLDVNPDAFYQRHASFQWGNFVGNLLMKGLIDRELVYKTLPFAISQLWNKFGPIIEEQRVQYNFGPDYNSGLEYLANEMDKMRKEKVEGPTRPFARSIEY